MLNTILRIAVALLLATFAYGCSGDENNNVGPRCGDGICSSNETPATCNRDCSFACLPGAARCSGNTLVTCLDDGLHEESSPCEPDEVCAVDRCVAVSEVGTPDVTADAGSDTTVEDTDAGRDVDEDITDDAEVLEDAPTDGDDDGSEQDAISDSDDQDSTE